MTTPPSAGWHSDPSGQHELRYSDGTRWTEHVADGGATSVDAYVAPPPPVVTPPLPPPPAAAPPVEQPTATWPAPTKPEPIDVAWSAIDEPIAPDPPAPFPPPTGQSPMYQAPPAHGAPPGGIADAPTSGGGTRWGLIALIVFLIVAVIGAGVAAVLVVRNGDDSGPSGSVPTAEPASGISGFGDDAEMDALALECEAGDWQACDDLYYDSQPASGYEDYGRTCGGRFDFQPDWCTDVF